MTPKKVTKKMKMITLKNWKLKKKIFNVKSKEKVPHQKFSRANDRIAENTIKNIRKFCNQMIQIQHKDDASEKVKDRQFFTQLAKVLSK